MEHKTQELDHMTTYAHLFSQVDLARLSTRLQPLSFLLFLVLFGGATNAHAYEVNEFDEGSDGWTIYPSTMGRTSESGWVNVGNDGEGSIRNTPNRTRYTYYWKLTKDIDLTQLTTPSLEVKFHFKGHGYDYARIQIGEELGCMSIVWPSQPPRFLTNLTINQSNFVSQLLTSRCSDVQKWTNLTSSSP